jgi:hypothetical protein
MNNLAAFRANSGLYFTSMARWWTPREDGPKKRIYISVEQNVISIDSPPFGARVINAQEIDFPKDRQYCRQRWREDECGVAFGTANDLERRLSEGE